MYTANIGMYLFCITFHRSSIPRELHLVLLLLLFLYECLPETDKVLKCHLRVLKDQEKKESTVYTVVSEIAGEKTDIDIMALSHFFLCPKLGARTASPTHQTGESGVVCLRGVPWALLKLLQSDCYILQKRLRQGREKFPLLDIVVVVVVVVTIVVYRSWAAFALWEHRYTSVHLQ